MSMQIIESKNELIFIVPNSEAPLEAQHKGIANRTVGSFYMSDNYYDCAVFLNNFKGEFYFDIGLSLANAESYITLLKNKGLANSFKKALIPQFDAIEALKWFIKQERINYYLISPPTVNSQKKYLKIDNNDQIYKLLKTFLLGDLTRLIIKRIGQDGFIMYIDKNDDFEEKISNNVISKWRQ